MAQLWGEGFLTTKVHAGGKALRSLPLFLLAAVLSLAFPGMARGQSPLVREAAQQTPPSSPLESTEDWNRRLQTLLGTGEEAQPELVRVAEDYRIGPDDLLDITVFEAPELNREARVSAGGEISLPLLGPVQAAGLTPHELEIVLQELLRRTYMKDPHVGVYVKEMQSHAVSVFGAVKRPGVYQIRGSKTLVEVLSLAEGLAEDAGDTVIVMRGSSPAAALAATSREPAGEGSAGEAAAENEEWVTASEVGISVPGNTEPDQLKINLKALLETGDPRYNVPIYPGDIVKVNKAGIVYVVGEVTKPGGFVLETNENISVLQALALAQGMKSTAARGDGRIIRTVEATGERVEIPVDLGKVVEGREPDPMLQPKDIVFVPHSAARRAFYRAAEAAISIVSGVIVWRR